MIFCIINVWIFVLLIAKLKIFQKADLGFGGLSMTYERYKAVDFSKIYLYTPVTFITPPPGLKPPVKLILEPFDLSVWITTLFSLIFVIVSQRLIVNKMIKDTKSDISWALISCLLRQGNSMLMLMIMSLTLTWLLILPSYEIFWFALQKCQKSFHH